MRVLVTGAHGQLGREICLRYEDKGCTVFSCGSQELDITRYQDVSFCVKDFQPDLIVNCAAYNAVDDAEIEWEQAFCVNGFGPKNLALAAIQVGADIVHFSTDYVFNGKQRRPYTIADRPDPISRYGESKLLGEQMILNHVHRFYLIRTSWVFGSGNENFVDKVLDWSDKKSSITVVDDQVSSPTYTKDLAQATDNLVSSGQYGLYHITN
ncbi:MAG TPA: dTDP-4-dehydrorhamnose reductase, partial [Methanospirillum sp.]|nr:dTDP-4-dehydrorhamnose reductase [Methanospirillum sp.]